MSAFELAVRSSRARLTGRSGTGWPPVHRSATTCAKNAFFAGVSAPSLLRFLEPKKGATSGYLGDFKGLVRVVPSVGVLWPDTSAVTANPPGLAALVTLEVFADRDLYSAPFAWM